MLPFLDPSSSHIQKILDAFTQSLRMSVANELLRRRQFVQIARMHDGLHERVVTMLFPCLKTCEDIMAVARFIQQRKRFVKNIERSFYHGLAELRVLVRQDDALDWLENSISYLK
jgi:hypothetical protein